ncbi:RecX family transcriptional regulator [Novosphingobium flavum]|uniref:RecX family transcriptional regulator n=1 Tax=Novosphingobium flavum TaxID=1778672 RepID=UPI0031B5DF6A
MQEILSRFVGAGYVDDAAYARMKAGSLRRRGYGERRVAQALGAAGIGEDLREDVRAGEGEQRRAAVALARRRRFGPFGSPSDPEQIGQLREKQLAAMLRAGHRLDIARAVIHAADSETVEGWAAEPGPDEDEE